MTNSNINDSLALNLAKIQVGKILPNILQTKKIKPFYTFWNKTIVENLKLSFEEKEELAFFIWMVTTSVEKSSKQQWPKGFFKKLNKKIPFRHWDHPEEQTLIKHLLKHQPDLFRQHFHHIKTSPWILAKVMVEHPQDTQKHLNLFKPLLFNSFFEKEQLTALFDLFHKSILQQFYVSVISNIELNQDEKRDFTKQISSTQDLFNDFYSIFIPKLISFEAFKPSWIKALQKTFFIPTFIFLENHGIEIDYSTMKEKLEAISFQKKSPDPSHFTFEQFTEEDRKEIRIFLESKFLQQQLPQANALLHKKRL